MSVEVEDSVLWDEGSVAVCVWANAMTLMGEGLDARGIERHFILIIAFAAYSVDQRTAREQPRS